MTQRRVRPALCGAPTLRSVQKEGEAMLPENVLPAAGVTELPPSGQALQGQEGRWRLAAELAERLRLHVAAEAFTAGATTFRVTCSVGVAHFTDVRQNVADLLQAADEALYRAKELGRDRVCVAGPQSAGP